MDLTYDEYIDFINHLFLQEFVDWDYKENTGGTSDALTVL